MRLREQIGGRMVFIDLRSKKAEQALQEIASMLSPVCTGRAGEEVGRGLLTWYTSGRPGVARGVAFPHARCVGLDGSALCLARSREGIDFGEGYDTPVRLVATLLSPAGEHSKHLTVLARMARLLRTDAVVERLIGAAGPDDMARVLEEEDEAAAKNDLPDAQQG